MDLEPALHIDSHLQLVFDDGEVTITKLPHALASMQPSVRVKESGVSRSKRRPLWFVPFFLMISIYPCPSLSMSPMSELSVGPSESLETTYLERDLQCEFVQCFVRVGFNNSNRLQPHYCGETILPKFTFSCR